MNQISIAWGHFPDAEIYTALVRGLTHAQLRYYAQPCAFIEFQDEVSEPVFLGSSRDQKDALICELEAAGYEIEDIKIVSAFADKEVFE